MTGPTDARDTKEDSHRTSYRFRHSTSATRAVGSLLVTFLGCCACVCSKKSKDALLALFRGKWRAYDFCAWSRADYIAVSCWFFVCYALCLRLIVFVFVNVVLPVHSVDVGISVWKLNDTMMWADDIDISTPLSLLQGAPATFRWRDMCTNTDRECAQSVRRVATWSRFRRKRQWRQWPRAREWLSVLFLAVNWMLLSLIYQGVLSLCTWVLCMCWC